MDTVSSYEAKSKLPELLRRVEGGERITITRHGHPVAQIVPMPDARGMTPSEAVAALLRFPRVRLPQGESVKAMIEEGRR